MDLQAMVSKHWKPLAAVAALVGGYFVLKGKSPATPAKASPTMSSGIPRVPAANMPSTVTPSGQRVSSSTVTSSPANAAAEVLADMIRTKGCKDPSTMAAVQAWQALVGGLTVDGKYGPMTSARLASFITTPVPPPCKWS